MQVKLMKASCIHDLVAEAVSGIDKSLKLELVRLRGTHGRLDSSETSWLGGSIFLSVHMSSPQLVPLRGT